MARTSNQPARLVTVMQLALSIVSMLAVGCAAPWLDSYDHEQSIHCRIDNPDRDSLWDTSDTNGNGVIDDNETIGAVFDLASLPRGENDVPSSLPFNSTTRSPQSRRISSPGFRDDLDGKSNSFFVVFSDGTPITARIDFDVLHQFNTGFDTISVTPYTETYGVQLSRSHRFTQEGTEPSSHDDPFLEVSYGARYHRLRETFDFDASSGFLGRTTLDTTYDNELVGPQLALNLGNHLLGWDLQLGSTLMLGYNLANADQLSQVGEDLNLGQINRPLSPSPNIVVHEQDNEDFASLGEIRAQAAYALSQSSTFRFGYTSLYFSHLRHVDTSINWSLPSFGINSSVTKDTWISGLHASVEWRR